MRIAACLRHTLALLSLQSVSLGMNDHNPKRRASATTWNKADIGRKFVAPTLQAVGRDKDHLSIAERRRFTDGLLGKHTSNGKLNFTLSDALQLPPFPRNGNVNSLGMKRGGA